MQTSEWFLIRDINLIQLRSKHSLQKLCSGQAVGPSNSNTESLQKKVCLARPISSSFQATVYLFLHNCSFFINITQVTQAVGFVRLYLQQSVPGLCRKLRRVKLRSWSCLLTFLVETRIIILNYGVVRGEGGICLMQRMSPHWRQPRETGAETPVLPLQAVEVKQLILRLETLSHHTQTGTLALINTSDGFSQPSKCLLNSSISLLIR